MLLFVGICQFLPTFQDNINEIMCYPPKYPIKETRDSENRARTRQRGKTPSC